MRAYRERFSEEIGQIQMAWTPTDFELYLTNAVTDPVEFDIDCLRSFGLCSEISEADRGAVVAEDDSRGLRIAEIGEHMAQIHTFNSTKVKGSVFGFCSRSNNDIDHFAHGTKGSVDLFWAGSVAEVEDGAGHGPTFGT